MACATETGIGVGSRVRWNSALRGGWRSFRGVVRAIVPAGESPDKYCPPHVRVSQKKWGRVSVRWDHALVECDDGNWRVPKVIVLEEEGDRHE